MNNTPNVSKPHDKGYKRDLSLPSEFLHFLKKYVGADWTKDLQPLHLEPKKNFDFRQLYRLYFIMATMHGQLCRNYVTIKWRVVSLENMC